MKVTSPETTTARQPLTLVFVSRRSCGQSRRMESLVAWVRVTKKRSVRVVDLDVDRSPELARQLGIRKTPSLLLLVRGQVVGRLEGRSTGREIEALLRPHLEEDGALAASEVSARAEEGTGVGRETAA